MVRWKGILREKKREREVDGEIEKRKSIPPPVKQNERVQKHTVESCIYSKNVLIARGGYIRTSFE